MATKTFEELKQLAIQIRDEKTNKQNTATRIGTQMLEHLDKLEQDYYDKTATDEQLIELSLIPYEVSLYNTTESEFDKDDFSTTYSDAEKNAALNADILKNGTVKSGSRLHDIYFLKKGESVVISGLWKVGEISDTYSYISLFGSFSDETLSDFIQCILSNRYYSVEENYSIKITVHQDCYMSVYNYTYGYYTIKKTKLSIKDKGITPEKTSFYEMLPKNEDYATNLIYNLKVGFYPTNVGENVGEFTGSSNYNSIVIDSEIGDIFSVLGVGGTTGRLWAKIKEGVITEVSQDTPESNEVSYKITNDGTFDRIVFNFDMNKSHELYYTRGLYDNKTYTDKITEKSAIKYIKEDLVYKFRDGYIATNINEEIGDVVTSTSREYCKINVKDGDFYQIQGEGGTNGRLWAKIKDNVVIQRGTANFEDTRTIMCDGTFDTLVFNVSKNKDYALYVNHAKTSFNLRGKKVIIVGDSSVANSSWAQRMCEELECEYKVFAHGGWTIRTQQGGDNPGNCLRYIIEKEVIPYVRDNWNNKVDVIMFQIGGNDIGSVSGTIKDAFSNTNYLTYKDDLTTYGSARYCYELTRRTYPESLVTVGTVFGRLGTDWDGNAEEINTLIRDMCQNFSIQVIEGGKFCGFAPILEPISPYYNDGNPGIANDRTNLSRDNAAYNYIDSENNIVNYETATNNGIIKDGYSKRYGMYTYDGKHQNFAGEEKVLKFMKESIKTLVE